MRSDIRVVALLVLAGLVAGCATRPQPWQPDPAITLEWAPRTICTGQVGGKPIVYTCRLDGTGGR